MIRFEYDPRLVEQATFLAARQDAGKECMLHETLDRLYSIEDGELRQRLFRERNGELFRRFGLDQIVPWYVRGFPLINGGLERCVVREADRAPAQSADLYREKSRGHAGLGDRVMILALCPDSFLEPARLGPWLHRQLQHIEDMLDERFAYEPNLPDLAAPQQNAVRDRYAAIWDVYVEGRLIRAGRLIEDNVRGLWSVFCKAFCCDAASTARSTFERVLAAGSVTHPQILAWATEPGRLFRGEEEDVRSENEVGAMA